jgi:hypothetical protein
MDYSSKHGILSPVLLTKFCRNNEQLNRQIIHMTWCERVKNAGVYTGHLVVRLRLNWTKVCNLIVCLLLDLSSTAVEKLAEFNDERKCLHCHLSFRFHSTETVKSTLVIVVMYLKLLNLNHFQSLWSPFLQLFFAVQLIFTHFYK